MLTVTIWHASWCVPCGATLRDLVPRLREEGVEPVTKDVDWCPCEAMDRDVDHLPTVTVDDGNEELMRCRATCFPRTRGDDPDAGNADCGGDWEEKVPPRLGKAPEAGLAGAGASAPLLLPS